MRKRYVRLCVYFSLLVTVLPTLHVLSNILYDRQAVRSSITCLGKNCHVENACIDVKGHLVIFDSTREAKRLREKILSIPLRRRSQLRLLGEVSSALLPLSQFSGSALIIDRYVDDNCGHILGDEAWPALRLALQFFNMQHIRTHGIGDVYIIRSREQTCDEIFEALTGSVNTLGQMKTRSCYRNVLLGMDGLSYADGYDASVQPYLTSPRFTAEMQNFRSLFYKHAKISEDRSASTILLMHKKFGSHMVNIYNRNEIHSLVSSEFPELKVVEASWSDHTVREQVQIVSDAKVMISLPGSDIMNAIFLRDNSRLLIYCRFVDGKLEASNEQALWFEHLHYIQTEARCSDQDVRRMDPQYVWVNTTAIRDILQNMGS